MLARWFGFPAQKLRRGGLSSSSCPLGCADVLEMPQNDAHQGRCALDKDVHMKPSLFIAIEGIDGSGKSTQCQRLQTCLHDRALPVVACADPGGTEFGNRIRELLLHHKGDIDPVTEALLFMASRAELVVQVIRPALEAGNIVLSDRYLLSNVAYQGYAGGLGREAIFNAGLVAAGNLVPDLTIVLDLPVEQAIPRRKAKLDRLEQRPETFHQAVREGFLAEARLHPDRIKVLDATKPIEEVSEQICQLINAELTTRFGPASTIPVCVH